MLCYTELTSVSSPSKGDAMLKKVTTIAVTLLLAFTLTGQRQALASSKAERQARATEK